MLKKYKMRLASSLLAILAFFVSAQVIVLKADEGASADWATLALAGRLFADPDLKKASEEQLQKDMIKSLTRSLSLARKKISSWLGLAGASGSLGPPVPTPADQLVAEVAVKKGTAAVNELKEKLEEIDAITDPDIKKNEKQASDQYIKLHPDEVVNQQNTGFVMRANKNVPVFKAPLSVSGFEKGSYYALISDVLAQASILNAQQKASIKVENKPKSIRYIEVPKSMIRKGPQGDVVTINGEQKPVIKSLVDQKDKGLKKNHYYFLEEK